MYHHHLLLLLFPFSHSVQKRKSSSSRLEWEHSERPFLPFPEFMGDHQHQAWCIMTRASNISGSKMWATHTPPDPGKWRRRKITLSWIILMSWCRWWRWCPLRFSHQSFLSSLSLCYNCYNNIPDLYCCHQDHHCNILCSQFNNQRMDSRKKMAIDFYFPSITFISPFLSFLSCLPCSLYSSHSCFHESDHQRSSCDYSSAVGPFYVHRFDLDKTFPWKTKRRRKIFILLSSIWSSWFLASGSKIMAEWIGSLSFLILLTEPVSSIEYSVLLRIYKTPPHFWNLRDIFSSQPFLSVAHHRHDYDYQHLLIGGCHHF